MEHALSPFIDRWSKSAGAERANYQLFLSELCDVLGVPRPEPTVDDDAHNAYVFERGVRFDNRDGTHTTKRIDLYKRGCFVCETKQGVEKEDEAIVLSATQTERRRGRKKGHGTRGTAAWDDAMLCHCRRAGFTRGSTNGRQLHRWRLARPEFRFCLQSRRAFVK